MKSSSFWALIGGIAIGAAAVAFINSDKGQELKAKVEKYLADRDIYFSEEKMNEFVMKVRKKIEEGIHSLAQFSEDGIHRECHHHPAFTRSEGDDHRT